VGVGKPQLVSKSSNILTYQDIFLDFSYEAFGTPEGLNAISIEVLKLSKIHVAIISDSSHGTKLIKKHTAVMLLLRTGICPCLPVTIRMESLNGFIICAFDAFVTTLEWSHVFHQSCQDGMKLIRLRFLSENGATMIRHT